MKQILVIGGTRFFGRKLVERLMKDGHRVTILTRGVNGNPFGNQVEHIIADRFNKAELAAAVNRRTFDLVYDNICYSPNEALEFCEVFNGKIGRLVFTSSMATYEADGLVKKEQHFNPLTYTIQQGSRHDFSYGEGKRQAEAILFKHAKFPVVAVRFPIVMGEDDYTERLHFYIEKVMHGEVVHIPNGEAEMSFILADEAAEFLHWAGESTFEGPINATANGRISMAALLSLVEQATGNKAIIETDIQPSAPYAIKDSWYMSNVLASEQGFNFSNLYHWLKPLIEKITLQQNSLTK